MSTVLPRGFTDHEHLDSVGLIHMNGRVYDPTISRFVSADPFVQFPQNSQPEPLQLCAEQPAVVCRSERAVPG